MNSGLFFVTNQWNLGLFYLLLSFCLLFGVDHKTRVLPRNFQLFIWIPTVRPFRIVITSYSIHYTKLYDWYDFALAIFLFSGVKCKVHPVLSEEFPSPTKRPHFSVLNKSKIKNTFGIEIPYWRDSLQLCLNKLEE